MYKMQTTLTDILDVNTRFPEIKIDEKKLDSMSDPTIEVLIQQHYVLMRKLLNQVIDLQQDERELQNNATKREILEYIVKRICKTFNQLFLYELVDDADFFDDSIFIETDLVGISAIDLEDILEKMEEFGIGLEDEKQKENVLSKKGERPSKQSSKLARFSPEYKPGVYEKDKTLQSIYEAKCVKFETPIESIPIMNLDENIFVCTTNTGLKQSGRNFSFTILGKSPIIEYTPINSGFFDVIDALSADAKHSLVWVSGDKRIKAFTANNNEKSQLKYTLWYGGMCNGILPIGDRLLASGNKGISYWDFNKLVEQSETISFDDLMDAIEGKRKLNVEFYDGTEDIWIDDDVKRFMEASKGQEATGKISNLKGYKLISKCPNDDSKILIQHTEKLYFEVFDLTKEVTLKYFIGHTQDLMQISTAIGDPNIISSASKDGTVKIWDLRSGQCNITLNENDPVSGVACVNVNGTPIVFSGGQGEAIRVWDLRKRLCAYELSTGNNAVVSLYWHKSSQSIIGGTERPTLDQFGNQKQIYDEFEEEVDDDIFEDVETEEDDDWPKRAKHQKNDFEEHFNASAHMILAYKYE